MKEKSCSRMLNPGGGREDEGRKTKYLAQIVVKSCSLQLKRTRGWKCVLAATTSYTVGVSSSHIISEGKYTVRYGAVAFPVAMVRNKNSRRARRQ